MNTMSCETTHNLDINDLEQQLLEAKKGIAKVDKKYVDYEDSNHLFDYDIDFGRFIEDVAHIMNSIKDTDFSNSRRGSAGRDDGSQG